MNSKLHKWVMQSIQIFVCVVCAVALHPWEMQNSKEVQMISIMCHRRLIWTQSSQ
jgi:hypothetical protein